MIIPQIPNQKSKVGFYFHIPFCPHICPYCDFVKTNRFSKKNVDLYFQELHNILDVLLSDFSNNKFMRNALDCTVYFGGGTPSLFNAKFYEPLLHKLRQKFTIEEITIESNPFTNNHKFFENYREIGIDRITLGAQSLCSDTLKTLGRRHTKENIFENIKFLKDCGFKQIQVDLIYGLEISRSIPIDQEITEIIEAGATGISAYGLTLEPRTLFGQTSQKIINEERAIEEYKNILNTCEDIGLRQIETSNFSFFDSKHNNIYWYGYPYFGIGTGAHGLLPPIEKTELYDIQSVTLPQQSLPFGIRYHLGDTSSEIAPGNNLLKFDAHEQMRKNFQFFLESPRTQTNAIEEMLFTLLRTEKGIPIDWLISATNNANILDKIQTDPKIQRGLNEGKITLTDTHVFLSNYEKIRGNTWALNFICAIQTDQIEI